MERERGGGGEATTHPVIDLIRIGIEAHTPLFCGLEFHGVFAVKRALLGITSHRPSFS